jgi:dolichyl-phosphate beta-glucosyltransferase
MRLADPVVTPDLSLVVPVFNEEARLPLTLDRLTAFARDHRLALEIVVADDGSRDRTAAVCREWIAAHHLDGVSLRLVPITHRGKGAAVRAGMGYVTGPIVGYCDADLSAGPDAIVQVLAAIRGGADVAMASRGLPESVLDIRQPWYREFAGRTFNSFLRWRAGIPFKDTQCGLKLFRAEAARQLFRHQRLDGFAFDLELVLVAMKLNLRIEEVPIHWAHAEGSKVSLGRDSLRMARDAGRVWRRLKGEAFTAGVPSDDAMHMMTGSEDRHWWHVAKRRLVAAQLQMTLPPRRCLDIGCGGGAMLAEAAALGAVVGTDLSVQALEHARTRGLEALVLCEAAHVALAPASFSTVLVLDVIEHHAQPEALLREIDRVLVPGGRVIVTVPAFQWMWSYADDVLGHYRRYTKRQLIDELTSAGFVVTRASYFHSWLLPVAWSFRMLRTILGRTGGADDFEVPPALNRVLLAVCAAERRFLARHNLPFGLSVMAVGEKA